nr:protein kinase-like domain-containing protein [Tanacetum cinerariifolium]
MGGTVSSPTVSAPKPNYDHLAHLKIPLESIRSATNNFAEENVVGRSGLEKSYTGQLMWSGELIDIHARRLNKEIHQQFWMEISLLSTLKHKNLVSLVGFCDENGEKIIITKLEIRGGLNQYLSDPMLLTWVRRLEICVGIAHALSYIHFDQPRDFSIIHRKLCSDAVLLNNDWEPKLSSFECYIRIEASERHLSYQTNKLEFVKGYGDPIYIENNILNHKSDMYSFGIVMFELLCGRKAVIADNNHNYLASLAITHYRENTLYDIIDPILRNQMHLQSFNILAGAVYDCLNEEQSRRPNIDAIVLRLEKALELQLKPQTYEQMLEETIRNLQEDNMRLRLEIEMQVEVQRQVACQVQEHMQQRELEANAREEAREWEWQQQMECQLEEHMQQRESEANAREWEWQQKMNDINSMLRDNYDPRPLNSSILSHHYEYL